MQLDDYAVYFEDEDKVFATGYDLPVPAVGDEVDIARTTMVVRKIVWRIKDALPLEKYNREYNRGRLTVHVVLGNHAKCRALLTNADVQYAKEKHHHPDATAYFSFEES